MRKKLSLSDFAKKIGVTRPAVAKAIASGRIPKHLIGDTELSTGKRVPMIIDPVAARAAFLGEGGLALTVSRSDPPATRDPTATASAADFELAATHGDTPPPIALSRARFEAYRADQAKIQLDREAERLVDAAAVKSQFVTMIVAARTRLLGVPSKAKGRIPHLTIDDIEVLDGLIREALEDIASGRATDFSSINEANQES